jgi:hypothetical protein
MCRAVVSIGNDLEPPDVIADVAAANQPCLDQIGEVAIDRRGIPRTRRELFGYLGVRHRLTARVGEQELEHGDPRRRGAQPALTNQGT